MPVQRTSQPLTLPYHHKRVELKQRFSFLPPPGSQNRQLKAELLKSLRSEGFLSVRLLQWSGSLLSSRNGLPLHPVSVCMGSPFCLSCALPAEPLLSLSVPVPGLPSWDALSVRKGYFYKEGCPVQCNVFPTHWGMEVDWELPCCWSLRQLESPRWFVCIPANREVLQWSGRSQSGKKITFSGCLLFIWK